MKCAMMVKRKGNRRFYLYGTTDDIEYAQREARRMVSCGEFSAVKLEDSRTGRLIQKFPEDK